VGSGLHPFRDPSIVEEFAARRQDIDVREHHSYAVEWRPDGVEFFLDEQPVWATQQAPRYPMQMMIAVFDFPSGAKTDAPPHVPVLAVDEVRGQSLS
jgi:hypothetical protein